eukprot:410264-Pelagomonas_calceolata.AAC.2
MFLTRRGVRGNKQCLSLGHLIKEDGFLALAPGIPSFGVQDVRRGCVLANSVTIQHGQRVCTERTH